MQHTIMEVEGSNGLNTEKYHLWWGLRGLANVFYIAAWHLDDHLNNLVTFIRCRQCDAFAKWISLYANHTQRGSKSPIQKINFLELIKTLCVTSGNLLFA